MVSVCTLFGMILEIGSSGMNFLLLILKFGLLFCGSFLVVVFVWYEFRVVVSACSLFGMIFEIGSSGMNFLLPILKSGILFCGSF